MARSRSPFVPSMEETGLQDDDHHHHQEEGGYLIHSQVRRIKKEEEEARELLLKLQLLETRPPSAAGFPPSPSPPRMASRPLSPLRRAGAAIPVVAD